MSNENGNLLRKARVAANMTQSELADAVEGVTQKDISKAERGITDLKPEQLSAVAKALGTTEEALTADEETDAAEADSLSDHAAEETTEEISVCTEASEESPAEINPESSEDTGRETPDEPGAMPEADDKTFIDLFRTADAARQKAAISVLKGEKQVCPDIMSLFAGMMSGTNGKDFVLKMNNFINSESGKNIINAFKGMTSKANGTSNEKSIFTSLPTFTYVYSITIYTLFLSFYFWSYRTDIKPEKI